MKKFWSRVLAQPFHPWLLGIYPILHLYSENLGLVIDDEVLIAIFAMTAATTLGFLVVNHHLRRRRKTAFMLSVCSLIFSFSGHVYVLAFIPKSLFVWSLLLLAAMAILLAFLWRIESHQFFAQVTPVLNVVALALTAFPSIKILTGQMMYTPIDHAFLESAVSTGQENPKVSDSPQHPDIYYVIPDGYPSDEWLREAMNYDNSEFTSALADRGFVIAENAQSNYGATLTSLASTLNMRYYDKNLSSFSDLFYLRVAIADNEVARKLKKRGYTYIQLLSGFLIPSPIAEINRNFTPNGPVDTRSSLNGLSTAIRRDTPEKPWWTKDVEQYYKQSFLSLYHDTTLFRVLASQLERLLMTDKSKPYRLFAGERFLATIDDVSRIARMPEATFALIHLMKPHLPVVFNEKGVLIRENYDPSLNEYFAEFEFANSEYLRMIDSILAESKHPPAIIFQADHGSTYGESRLNDSKLVHFDAYAAYLVPEGFTIEFPRPFTSINTFPLLMNTLFETDLEFRGDRLVELVQGYDAPFEQKDVTELFLRS